MTKDTGTASIEAKKKWIKDLLYGGYPQTQGTLRSSKGYCCLGVYLAGRGNQLPVCDPSEDENSEEMLDEGPPGLYQECVIDLGDFQDTGITLNDSGKSFEEIADRAMDFYGISLQDLQ